MNFLKCWQFLWWIHFLLAWSFSNKTQTVFLSDRKRFLWSVRTSPCSSRPTPPRPPCTSRARWPRPTAAASARPPNPVQNPPSPSGWAQPPRTPGREESMSTGPGESWSGPGTGSRAVRQSVWTQGFSRRSVCLQLSCQTQVWDCSFVL